MLTREQVLHEQRDLARLCADRPVPTVELFEWNAFYGHAAVLKAAAGLPADRPLHLTLPHGVTFLGRPNAAEAGAPIATAYSYQREYDEALSRDGTRAVIRSAAPLCYVRDIVGAPPASREGVLYFPSHSTRFSTADAEYDRIAEMLLGLPSHLGPVRVCCYYMDILRGHHQPFLDRGIPVYSAGHQYDPLFLVRLWQLLRMHRHVYSNARSTHLAYAMYTGCSFTFLSAGNVQHHTEPGYEDWVITIPQQFQSMLESLYADGVTRDDATARATATDLIGASRKLSTVQLRACLLAAERRARTDGVG
jgi:hypothetical protein